MGISAFDGHIILPPGSTLPTASVAYSKVILILQGAPGSRDRVYMCLKSDANVYAWDEIVNGGV